MGKTISFPLLAQGSPVALVAVTNPDFVRFFFACQYAGLVPVPLPVSVNLGNHRAYVDLLRGLLADCQPEIAMPPSDLLPLVEAAAPLGKPLVGDATAFDGLPEADLDLLCPEPTDLAYCTVHLRQHAFSSRRDDPIGGLAR